MLEKEKRNENDNNKILRDSPKEIFDQKKMPLLSSNFFFSLQIQIGSFFTTCSTHVRAFYCSCSAVRGGRLAAVFP